MPAHSAALQIADATEAMRANLLREHNLHMEFGFEFHKGCLSQLQLARACSLAYPLTLDALALAQLAGEELREQQSQQWLAMQQQMVAGGQQQGQVGAPAAEAQMAALGMLLPAGVAQQ